MRRTLVSLRVFLLIASFGGGLACFPLPLVKSFPKKTTKELAGMEEPWGKVISREGGRHERLVYLEVVIP